MRRRLLLVPCLILAAACGRTDVPEAPPGHGCPPPPADPCGPIPEGLRPQRFLLSAEAVDQPLLTGRPQTGGMRSGRVVLAPGGTMSRHSTNANEEMLVFLKGTVRVVTDAGEFEGAEGQTLYVPPRTAHEVRNDGPGEARYVFVVAPAGR